MNIKKILHGDQNIIIFGNTQEFLIHLQAIRIIDIYAKYIKNINIRLFDRIKLRGGGFHAVMRPF